MRKILTIMLIAASFYFLNGGQNTAYAAKEWWPFKKNQEKSPIPAAVQETQKIEIEETAPAVEPAPSVEPALAMPENLEITDMTNEEIAARLREIFQYHPNIPAGIQGLETKKGDDGTVSYEFNGISLNALDKLTLSNLLRNANNQLSLENMDRTQKQLQALKRLNDMDKVTKTQQQLKNLQRINDLTRTQQSLRQSVPNIPKVYSPPQIPKTYKAPQVYKPPRRY